MRKGFTLIELLIVVAIIGILAAVAVPNFFNARHRAVLSRVQADHRRIATAMEIYQLENKTYPTDAARGYHWGRPHGWVSLTTPISYISLSTFQDPFKAKLVQVGDQDPGSIALYELGTGNENGEQWPATEFCLVSIGPDSGLNQPGLDSGSDGIGDDTNGIFIYPNTYFMFRFDPSNGLVSRGDIYSPKGGKGFLYNLICFNGATVFQLW